MPGGTNFGRASRHKTSSPNGPNATGASLRRETRQRTTLTGKLALYGGEVTVDCTIMDLTKSGARVRVERGKQVRGDVILVHPLEKKAYQTRVVWRRGQDIGLEFKATHKI